jgi:hypothetical protein
LEHLHWKAGTGAASRPQGYGLLPIIMWILLGLGLSSGSLTTLAEIPSKFNALTSASAAGFSLAESAEVIPTSTPLRLICSTSWPLRSFFVKRNVLSSDALYRHPAEPTAASISISNFPASSVSATANSYGVPKNGCIRILTCPCWYSSSTRSAAFCFNCVRSTSKEAASCRASRARIKAFDAELSAFLAEASAFPRKASAFPALVAASVAVVRAPDAVLCALPASLSAFARECSAACARVSASPDFVSASSALVNALDALVEASLDLASREPITCSERASFRWPYQYPAISHKMAMAKNHMPIESNRCFLSSCLELCANASATTSSAKNTRPTSSRSLWASLTESSEFQSGNIARSIIFTFG